MSYVRRSAAPLRLAPWRPSPASVVGGSGARGQEGYVEDMHFAMHTPRAPLDAFVEHLWMLRDAPGHAQERIMPSGTVELVVNLAEDEFCIRHSAAVRRHRGAMVSGCYGTAFDVETRAHASIIG